MTISAIGSSPLSAANSTQHTYGLSGSGIDVDAQVKALMQAATVPYTKMWQKEQVAEWKKAEYNTFYNSIKTYNDNTVFNYTLQSTLLPQAATSSNTSIATATANADAAGISHSLTVSQLATGVSLTSTAAITTGSSKDTLAHQLNITGDPFIIQISNNGTTKSITVDPTKSIYDFVSSINNAGINVKANYDANLDRFFLYTGNTGSTAKIDFSGTTGSNAQAFLSALKLNNASSGTLASQFSGLSGSFTLQVANSNGATGTVSVNTATDSLQTFMDKLNAAGVNATASYDQITDKVVISTSDGGSLTFTDPIDGNGGGVSFLTGNLKLAALSPLASGSTSSAAIGLQSGKDAQITLDGASLTESSNQFTISGVTYNLQSTGSTTVSVSADIDKIVANVQSFVDSYNTMLSSLNTEVDQAANNDYLPLTDDQKASMKDSDITTWTAKAKSGLLHSDSILREAIDSIRNDVASPVSGLTGKYNSGASIGITTGDYTEEGKLYLDTTKLRTALQADPTIVSKIFGSTGTTGNTSSQGIAVRMHNDLTNAVSKIKTVAGTTADTTADAKSDLALQITDYKTRLSALSDKLQDLQTRYYNQFDAMETALQQLNSQSSYITSLLGSSK